MSLFYFSFLSNRDQGSVSGSGRVKESTPEAAECDDATEGSLILFAIRNMLNRMNYACRVVIHTECTHVAAAITQRWPEAWRENGWKNSKGKDVKNAELWEMILQELEEAGHTLEAEPGKHEWSEWMRWNLSLIKPLKNVFGRVSKTS